MKIPSVTGGPLNRSPVQYFLESSWQGKAVQILCAISIISLIYCIASRFIKTNQSPSQNPVNLNGRVVTKPDWLKEINENTWKEKVDIKKHRLDFTGAPLINSSASAKGLKALSERVEYNKGITSIVIPKGLTLKIVLDIANENSIRISSGDWHDKIITEFGDIPADQTRVLFFTNSILKGTRNHTPDQHAFDITTIGEECGVAIQTPQVRDFMALLVLTYLNSPEDARTLLYSSCYTRLLEYDKKTKWVLFGSFAPSGLYAFPIISNFARSGVGAFGSSEDIL
jgi:hypothetical protein